jgi:hypothetical protein
MKPLLGNQLLLLPKQIEMTRRKMPTSPLLLPKRGLLPRLRLVPKNLEKNLRRKNKLKHTQNGSPAKGNLNSRLTKFGSPIKQNGRAQQLCWVRKPAQLRMFFLEKVQLKRLKLHHPPKSRDQRRSCWKSNNVSRLYGLDGVVVIEVVVVEDLVGLVIGPAEDVGTALLEDVEGARIEVAAGAGVEVVAVAAAAREGHRRLMLPTQRHSLHLVRG